MVFGLHSIDFSNISSFQKFDVFEPALILLFDTPQLCAVPQNQLFGSFMPAASTLAAEPGL